jgi:hypothetical protein
MPPRASPLGVPPLAGAPLLSARLQEEGHAVCDGAAGKAWCAAVRDDINALHAAGLLQRSLNRVTTARAGEDGAGQEGHLCDKVGIHELDIVLKGELLQPAALAAAPALRRWLRRSVPAAAACCSGAEAEADDAAAAEDGSDGAHADGCAALIAQLNAAAPWLALTHLARWRSLAQLRRSGAMRCLAHRSARTRDLCPNNEALVNAAGHAQGAVQRGRRRLLPHALRHHARQQRAHADRDPLCVCSSAVLRTASCCLR